MLLVLSVCADQESVPLAVPLYMTLLIGDLCQSLKEAAIMRLVWIGIERLEVCRRILAARL